MPMRPPRTSGSASTIELARLNAAYERRFGFRYCVFVAGRPRAALVLEMTHASESDRAAEIERALDAVVDIAADRYATLTAPSPKSDPMTIEMGPNRYGKARIRLVKVDRLPDRHVVRDLTVRIGLEGDFAAAHISGENGEVIATDTMKNTVYALAKDASRAPSRPSGRFWPTTSCCAGRCIGRRSGSRSTPGTRS